MKHKILGLALLALPLVACNDFLTREPYDKLRGDNDETWNSEDVIKYSMYNVYPAFFKGYNSWQMTGNELRPEIYREALYNDVVKPFVGKLFPLS